MQTLFGVELSPGLKWLIAIAATLVLLALFGLIARRITGGKLRIRGQGGARARQPRLGVVDVHDLDNQRQLVLIRRDNVEHLVMIGGASDVVVETNILRSGARVAAPIEPPLSERLAAPEPPAPAEAPRTEPRRTASPPAQASAAPEALPPLPTRAAMQPPAARSDAPPPAAVPALAVTAAAAAPSFARDHAPAPAASPVELDDMARQLEEALKRPFSAVRPSGAPAAEPPAPEKPAPQTAIPEKAAPESAPKGDEAVKVEAPAAPIVAPPLSGRPIPVPIDVGASLEMALGLKPEPAVSAAPAEQKPGKPPAEVASAAGKVAAVPLPEPVAKPDKPAAPIAVEPRIDPPRQPPESKVAPTPEPVAIAPKPVPVEEPKPAVKVETTPVPPSAPAPEPQPVQIDPFSVDAIEAEFARLLGRDPKPKS